MRWFWRATILALSLAYRIADAGYFDSASFTMSTKI